MHVQPGVPLEQRLRDEHSVGDRDDRLLGQFDRCVELFRLEDRDAEAICSALRRGGRKAAAATARPIRLREEEGDVMACGKPFEHIGPERSRGRNADTGHD